MAGHKVSNDEQIEMSRTEKAVSGCNSHNGDSISANHQSSPPLAPSSSEESSKWAHLGIIYTRRRNFLHLFVFLLSSGFWITSLVLHHRDKNWVIPFLVWLVINLRILTFYVPARYILIPILYIWKSTAVRVGDSIPQPYHAPLGGLVFLGALILGAMASEEFEENNRKNRAVSLAGMFTFLVVLYATSKSRKHVNWRTVIGGMTGQYIIGIFVLRTGVGYSIFRWIANTAAQGLGYSQQGVVFLTDSTVASYGWFILVVIPAIIFFVSVVQVLFHFGYVQWAMGKLAVFVNWALQVSGAEAIVAAATPFVGQGESAMLVRPFLPYMTKAEIHQVLTCGFATIAGSVLAGYIQLGISGEVLVSSCVMSIPASIAISKLRYPETEETLTKGQVVMPPDDERAQNGIHAFANGTWLGLKIGGTIVASLLCILSVVALVNGLLGWLGGYLNADNPPLSLQLILGYVLFPVTFLLGVPTNGDILTVSKLIAEKIITVGSGPVLCGVCANVKRTSTMRSNSSRRKPLICHYGRS